MNSRQRRASWLIALGSFLTLSLLAPIRPANAQMIDVRQMHGIPRPEPKLPAGSVTVRVIRGSLAKRAVGVEVTLSGGGSFGASRKALTDAEGRARFDGLPVGASDVVARASVPASDSAGAPIDKTDEPDVALESQRFEVLPGVGIALLLTTPPGPDDLPKATSGAGGPGGEADGASAMQMPAPGQVHGIPLADDKIPMGTLEVVVAQGSMSNVLPDVWVDLVGVDPAGNLTRSRARTNVRGRAQFRGLDAKFAYYADIVANGVEQISNPIISPPDSGASVVLTPTGPSSEEDAQVQQLRATDDLEGGQLLVGAFLSDGSAAKGARLSLTRLDSAGAVKVVTPVTPTNDQGQLVWTGLGVNPEDMYVIVAESEGGTFRSRPFHMMPGAKGTALALALTSRILVGVHVVGELQDQFLHFQASYTVANLTGTPIDFTKQGLSLPLPRGFAGAQVAPDKQNVVKVVPDSGLEWRGLLGPGEDSATLTFLLPITDGASDLTLDTPSGLARWMVVMAPIPGLSIEAPASAEKKLVSARDGTEYSSYSGEPLAEGKVLRFRFDGLPRPEPTFARRRSVAVALSALLLLAGLVVALLANRGLGGRRARRRAELSRTTDRLYAELTAVEAQRRANVIDERVYQRERKDRVALLERSLRELDQIIDEAAP